MKTKIVSFYANLPGSTYYSDCAKKLSSFCIKNNISHDIVELSSKGSYMLNCLQKPKFIKDMMKKHNCPLIWMDCDTDLKKPFTAFDDVSEDIGFASHTGDIQGIKASPVFFNNKSKFDFIIDSWIFACEEGLKNNGAELDHDALKHSVIPKIYNNISIFIISKSYNEYCNGEFLVNGNSKVVGKTEIHKKMDVINRKRPSL